jgi:hypothetical protein
VVFQTISVLGFEFWSIFSKCEKQTLTSYQSSPPKSHFQGKLTNLAVVGPVTFKMSVVDSPWAGASHAILNLREMIFSPEVICVTLELTLTGHPFLDSSVFCSPWTNHPYLPNHWSKCFQIDTIDAHLHFIKVEVLLNWPIPTFKASKWPSNIGETKILASTDKISNYGLSTFINRWGSTLCDCLWSFACLTQIWKHLAKWFGRYGWFSQGEQIYVCRGGHHSQGFSHK